jgi:hypothetical protein
MRCYYQSFIEMIKAFAKTRQHRLRLTPALKHSIDQWHTLVHLFNGKSVFTGLRRRRCMYQAYSDASFACWGWAWAGRTQVGVRPKAYNSRFGQMSKLAANFLITAENDPLQAERIWIAFCEVAASLFCLRRILPYCEPRSTLVFHEDNQNVVSWLKKLRRASTMSAPVIQEIAWLLACFNVELDVRYIASAANKTADGCSRWASMPQAERKKCIANYMHDQPTDWTTAGIVWHRVSRPELLHVMDVWTPLDCT